MRHRIPFLLLVSCLFWFAGSFASPRDDSQAIAQAQEQVERANAKLEKLREGYAAGVVSRRQLEDAEADARDLEQRLQSLNDPNRQPGLDDAKRRVEEARYDYEKAAARAKRSAELYDVGAVSRNDNEAVQATAQQAETTLKLYEELGRRLEAIAAMPKTPRPYYVPPGGSLSNGDSGFSVATFYRLEDDFFRQFHHLLPVSAFGESETHEKMGFDHEGRVDIALNPDSPEGRWLIAQLEARHIPYIAFRSAVPGKATGPHIHIGFPSPHLT
jgi:cell division protein FtsB